MSENKDDEHTTDGDETSEIQTDLEDSDDDDDSSASSDSDTSNKEESEIQEEKPEEKEVEDSSSDDDSDDDDEDSESENTSDDDTKSEKPKKERQKRRRKKGQKIRAYWNYKENKGYVNFVKQVYFNGTVSLLVMLEQLLNQTYKEDLFDDNKDETLDAISKLVNDTKTSEEKDPDESEENDPRFISFAGVSKQQLTNFMYKKMSDVLKNADEIKKSRMTSKAGRRLHANDIRTAMFLDSKNFGFMDPSQTITNLDGKYRQLYVEMLLCLLRHTPKNLNHDKDKKGKKKPGPKNAKKKSTKKKPASPENTLHETPVVNEKGIFFSHFALTFKPKCAEFDQQAGKKDEYAKNLFAKKKPRTKKVGGAKGGTKRKRDTTSLSESNSTDSKGSKKSRSPKNGSKKPAAKKSKT